MRVEDYDKMIECGIFDENDRIELWNGVLVKMSPKAVKHRTATTKATAFFYKQMQEKAVIQVQASIRLSDFSELEPILFWQKRRCRGMPRDIPRRKILC